MKSGYEKIRDRRRVLEANLDDEIRKRQKRRQEETRKHSSHIHTTEESMHHYACLNDKANR